MKEIYITGSKGEREYLLLKPEIERGEGSAAPTSKASLLRVSIQKLLDEQDEAELKRNVAAQEHNNKKRSRNEEEKENIHDKSGVFDSLWVDKYMPKQYHELLSDDQVNRNVFRWIKSWDDVVFKKASNAARPEHGLILIVGSPGVGKTTLAHVLAKQAGYRPVEINASDDRGGEAFSNRVYSATQMQSVFGEKKPNLLIVDEVDGLPVSEGKGAVQVLLDLAGVQKQNTKENKPDADQQKKKKKKPKFVLNRPIICICNDQYTPALRKLREKALIFKVDPPTSERLVLRLAEICKKEGFQTTTKTLGMLVQMAGSDVRACLNALQFLRHHSPRLTDMLLSSNAVSFKDSTKPLFSIWESVFKEQKKSGIHHDKLTELYASVSSFGDTDKILEGCYKNFVPVLMHRDPTMHKMIVIEDQFGWSDILNRQILAHQSFQLTKYQPIVALMINRLCESKYSPKLEFPMDEAELRKNLTHCNVVLNSFQTFLPPHLMRCYSKHSLTLDLVPLFLQITSPEFRAINSKMMSPQEKEKLRNLIGIFCSYHVKYVQEVEMDAVTGEKLTVFKLDPPLEDICKFALDSKEIEVPYQLTMQQKHLLSIELNLEEVRRKEKQKQQAPNAKRPAVVTMEEIIRSSSAKKAKTTEPAQRKDFFGRVIEEKFTPDVPDTDGSADVKPIINPIDRMHYKFHEGFTNAVRRTVYVKDFLDVKFIK